MHCKTIIFVPKINYVILGKNVVIWAENESKIQEFHLDNLSSVTKKSLPDLLLLYRSGLTLLAKTGVKSTYVRVSIVCILTLLLVFCEQALEVLVQLCDLLVEVVGKLLVLFLQALVALIHVLGDLGHDVAVLGDQACLQEKGNIFSCIMK